LEDGDSLKQHSVTVSVRDKEISELNFFQVFDSEVLFRINIAGFDKMATCYRLNAMTSEDIPFSESLQLRLDDGQPCLVPLVDSEAAPNAACVWFDFWWRSAFISEAGRVSFSWAGAF
jgi:hypothetical protein